VVISGGMSVVIFIFGAVCAAAVVARKPEIKATTRIDQIFLMLFFNI